MRPKRDDRAGPRLLGALTLALLGATLAAPAHAVNYVRSVEYVEVTLTGTTIGSTNLTKGQIPANCVPFASAAAAGTDARFGRVFTDVYFQASPSRVTVQRDNATGSVSVGVFVVEFDPSYVNVHQGTFVNAQAAAQPTTSVVPLVNLAKAALVFYYRYNTETVPYSQVTTAGWFGTTTQLNWQRSDASVGTVNGHYYVFEARNAEFSVQATSFALGASATANSAPVLATPIDPDKTMVIASYRTDYPDDDNEDGQFRVALTGDARVTAYRTWGGGSGSNNTPDIRVFVVQFSGVRVQRGTLAYADTDTQQTATIEPVRTATALAWNVVATGPGAIEHRAFSSPDSDGGFQRLKLASATSVQGDRDGICGTPGECQGVGSFEVVDFDPIGRMRVKSGTYVGNNTSDRPIFVGFQPDVVFVKREDATNTVVRTSTMGLDQTKSLNDNGVAPYLGGIKSFTADGFTLGTHADVNGIGPNTTYYWIAFKAAPGELKVGSYTGDNASGRVIPNVGFQPNFVITLPEGSGPVSGVPWLRSSTMLGNEVFTADVTGLVTERIQGMEPDGFRVGNQASVNGGGAIIHYIAWNQVAGRTAVGTYTGTGIDPTNHDEVGFMPEWVLIKRNDNTRPWIHKPASMFPSADYQAGLGPYPVVNGFSDIKTLRPLGFQVGVSQRVNVNPIVYHWIAFGPHAGGVNYRSIGPAANHAIGTVQATPGSTQVLGTGTGWRTANRGRGDRMQITGSSLGDYTVASVASDTVLYLTVPYEGTVGPGKSFSLQRKFVRPSDWVGCIDGPLQAACGALEAGATVVSSTSLVTDDRVEVGILYNDDGPDGDSLPEPFVFPVSNQPIVWLTGITTDATRNITLTVDAGNRHAGVGWNGAGATPHVVFDYSGGTDSPIRVAADFVTIEWIDLRSGNQPGFSVGGGSGAITASNGSVQSTIVLRNNIAHAVDMAFDIGSTSIVLDIYDNIAYGCNRFMRMEADQATDPALIRVLNNTVWGCTEGFHIGPNAKGRVLFRNNIAAGSAGSDFLLLGMISPQSSHNLSEDATAGVGGASPAGGGWPSVTLGPCPLCVSFTSTSVGSENLHLLSTSRAIDQAANLASVFTWDIDGGIRTGGWDIGADEFGVTTAVRLQSFAAVPADGSVLLEWRTASELDNLGFHVYRSPSASGPWTRLNASLIAGLGSSAVGQAYSFRDAGLTNGTRYFYRLEDVDASSKTTSHGPVSAVPTAGASGGAPGSDPPGGSPSGKKKSTASATCPDWVLRAYASSVGADSATASLRCSRHGDPEAVSLDVVSRSARGATLELRTGGFYALHTQPGAGEPSGTVRVFIPGFDFPQDEKAAALPIRRALADAIVGRRVQLGGVRALELVRFKGLVPSALGKAEMQVGRDGTVRASRRGLRPSAKHFPKGELATLLPSVFQGETKSAVVEIAPLRFDAQRLQLVLAKRVLVRLLFTGRETGESGTGSVGRAPGSRKPVAGELLARLHTTSRGLYAASFEQLFPQRRRGFAASQLRLERQGEAVAFHVEPISDSFGPGSRLYFFADKTPISTDFSAEVAYALVRATDGLRMPIVSAAATGVAAQSPSTGFASFETDRFYQPGLLDAADPWLWEAVSSGTIRAKTFSLAGTDATSAATAELDVFLQGASESGNAVDHHVSVSVNGVPVGDAQFAGKKPYRMSLSLPASLLREGANDLSLTNVADTGVSSYVFLDRFAFAHPQLSSLAGGRFDGEWPETGSVSLSAPGAVSGPILVVDATGAGGTSGGTGLPAWLTGHETTAGAVRFRAEAGHRYWVASDAALFSPRIAAPQPSELKSAVNQADYLLIAPRAFLAAAEPLLQRRQDQGLATRAVAFEEIVSEFGHGQGSAEAIKAFLAYAFHSWARPSPRYVLLLGDSSYDPRNFIGSSQPSPLPALWAKTSYLWTVSDPQLAAVNGDDALPDLAIGRLPAATVEQAEALVAKLIAWESSGQGLAGAATLVADNPDLAGDFEADVEDIRVSFLGARETQVLKLSVLGAQTRPSILDALNGGLSYLSYVGHGGAAVWASENVWNSWDAPSLQAQSQQPLLVTMNCLNGYFVAPAFDSLSESLLKAEGRGAIASFSPSGLSLDGPAHQYHRALMAELTSGQHQRLGDAILAAQKTYADLGLMPELLSVYHLLGDPATGIR